MGAARKSASAAPASASAIAQLDQEHELKIIAITEPLKPKDVLQSSNKRNSGASVDEDDQNFDTHPASLEADLKHYKELFSKLRFSYVEQVTKEKFLKNLTEDPPRLVEATENIEKEKQILGLKASLKERKLEVAEILRQLEEKGKELALRYDAVQLRRQQLADLPTKLEGLEASIAQLKQDQTPTSSNPELGLPLPDTLRLLNEREAELAALNAQIAQMQPSLPNRAKELEKLERELKPLETQRQGTVAAAKEARRRKVEGGGMGDELEEKGRWLTASEKALREMLELES